MPFKYYDDDESDDDYILQSDKRFHLPKLAVPFKDAERGWNNDVVVDQATLYLNILGYGKGGNKSLSDTKFKKAEKPEWWDGENNFQKYSHDHPPPIPLWFSHLCLIFFSAHIRVHNAGCISSIA